MGNQNFFLNHYKCGNCGNEWDDIYDCAVDDDCSDCGSRHYTPVWSANETASYRRFLFIEPGDESQQAIGPFETAEARDAKARKLVERFPEGRILMLDLVEDDDTILPVVFPYQTTMLAPVG